MELLRRMGLGWVLYRIGYALRRQTGLLKRRFPARSWEAVRLTHVLRPDVPAAPPEYRLYREAGPARFLFAPGEPPDQVLLQRIVTPGGMQRTLAVADDYCRGRFLYYSHHVFDLGWPPNWLLNPLTGGRHEARTHWCDYPTFSPTVAPAHVAPANSRCRHGLEAHATLGDIKDVWEPSRFASAFWLVRAYALTHDENYPRAFWEMFESWRRQNPPNLGPNWKCGQETALRTMAWCFALYAFWKSPATTAERIADLAVVIALQAERIAGNIGYAISQKNNHGLSEATGLLTVGLLFPEFKRAEQWEALGRRTLEREVRRQIYDDGSYVQQSMNYHRVMLHDCLWAIRLAELNGRPLSAELRERVARAAEFLHEMLDLPSGRVPNYGANDGALVLPLSSCDYTDYRPTVQAARYQATGRRVLPPGPWDEMTLWLFGSVAQPPAAVSIAPAISRCHTAISRCHTAISRCHTGETAAPQDAAFTGQMPVPPREGEVPAEPARQSVVQPTSRRFDAGGYYTLRAGDTWCMIRCHTYRDRPAHVDMLHVDLWHKGVNVLGDSGTYKYYATDSPALERYFKDIRAHNTIEIDGAGPLELVSRFLWLPWPQARCVQHRVDFWQGEHQAYNRPPWHVIHRRSVQVVDERTWTIIDDLAGRGEHRIALRWHLADGAVLAAPQGLGVVVNLPFGRISMSIEGPAGLRLEVLRGVCEGTRTAGWASDYYAARTPRSTIEVTGDCTMPAQLVTRIVLDEDTGSCG